jgi:hypothetical protein
MSMVSSAGGKGYSFDEVALGEPGEQVEGWHQYLGKEGDLKKRTQFVAKAYAGVSYA